MSTSNKDVEELVDQLAPETSDGMLSTEESSVVLAVVGSVLSSDNVTTE